MAGFQKNNSLDDIVNLTLDISNPTNGNSDFSSMLVIVSAPKAPEKGMSSTDGIFEITSAKQLVNQYGYTTDEDAYKVAKVIFDQRPQLAKVQFFVRKVTDGTAETIKDCLDRANSMGDFYGIYIVGSHTATDIVAAAEWTEFNEKLFQFDYQDITAFPFTDVQDYDKKYIRTHGIFSGLASGYDADSQPEYNVFAGAALMAKCFGYAPGSESWDSKELADIEPSGLSEAQKADLTKKSITTFLRYANRNVSFGGKTIGGEWVDVIRFRDWLKDQVQVNIFEAKVKNPKIPYTDNGIAIIKGAITQALDDGVAAGGIPQTEYDADNNPILGYKVSVPLSANISATDKKSRKLKDVSFVARLAGAIHIVEVYGNLTYEQIFG